MSKRVKLNLKLSDTIPIFPYGVLKMIFLRYLRTCLQDTYDPYALMKHCTNICLVSKRIYYQELLWYIHSQWKGFLFMYKCLPYTAWCNLIISYGSVFKMYMAPSFYPHIVMKKSRIRYTPTIYRRFRRFRDKPNVYITKYEMIYPRIYFTYRDGTSGKIKQRDIYIEHYNNK